MGVEYEVIRFKDKEIHLTARQLDTLIQIEHYMLKNHVPPTVRELCELCCVSSTSTMQERLAMLREKGLVRTAEGVMRGVTSVRIEYRRI